MKNLSKKLLSMLFLIMCLFNLNASNASDVQAQADHQYFIPFVQRFEQSYAVLGPDGGSVECLAVDPNNSDILYAGTWGNGIYKSFNGGETWIIMNAGLPIPFIYDIAIDPSSSGHILISVYKEGVYESNDGGSSWHTTSGWPEDTVVYSIDFHPIDSSIVFAGIRVPTIYDPPNAPIYPGYVYKSTDGGGTWVNKSNGLAFDYVYDLAIDPNDPDVIYAAMHTSGVYKTENGAETWQKKWESLRGFDVRSVDVHPVTSTVYIGHWDGQGVSYSNNGGDFWYKIGSTVDEKYYVYEIQVDPNHPSTLYLSSDKGLLKCENPYFSSDCEVVAHQNLFVYDLALDVNGPLDGNGYTSRMYTGMAYYGIHKSVDAGGTFSTSHTGLKANVIPSVINDPIYPDILYMSVYGRGVWKSFDEGQTWTEANTNLPVAHINFLAFRPGNANVIYASSDAAGLFRSDNAGASWSSINAGLSRSPIDKIPATVPGFGDPAIYPWMDLIDLENSTVPADLVGGEKSPAAVAKVLSLGFNPVNPNQMIAGTDGDGVMKTNNGGDTWESTFLWDNVVYDTLIDISQPQYFYYIGLKNQSVEVSDADRQNWLLKRDGFHYEADVFALAMADSGIYFAGTESGVYKTVDGGDNWIRLGLNHLQINDLYIDPAYPDEIWAATSDGLYRSSDSGLNWDRDNNFFNQNVLIISKGFGNYSIYLGLSGGNLYGVDP